MMLKRNMTLSDGSIGGDVCQNRNDQIDWDQSFFSGFSAGTVLLKRKRFLAASAS
jgi:hypothetical protein